MLMLNDDWGIERDKFGWTLHQWRDGTNTRTGEATRAATQTFHGSLAHTLLYVLDVGAGDCDTAAKLYEHLENASKQICDAVGDQQPMDAMLGRKTRMQSKKKVSRTSSPPAAKKPAVKKASPKPKSAPAPALRRRRIRK